jgi:hypothetical protein
VDLIGHEDSREGNGEVEIERIPGDHKGTIIGILLGIYKTYAIAEHFAFATTL